MHACVFECARTRRMGRRPKKKKEKVEKKNSDTTK